MQDFTKLLNPLKIAIVGASQNPRKVASTIFNQLNNSDFKGEVIPVNPKYEDINGTKVFANLNDIPDQIDIAVIAIPAEQAVAIFESLEVDKVKFAVVISGGFHQHGEDNLEDRLLELAKQKNVRIVGPNSLGYIYPKNQLNLSFAPLTPPQGNVSLLSQSGAVLTIISDLSHDYGLGIAEAYSIGDKIDLDEIEILEHLIASEETEVIGGYVEHIKNPDKFIELVQSSSKPVIMLQPLESKEAKDFADQHSGETSNNSSIKEVYAKAGVTIVESVEDLFFTMLVNQWCVKPVRNRVGIISNTGGFAAITTDSLVNAGFEIPNLSEQSKTKIIEDFENKVEQSNPLDILGDATSEEYSKGLDILLNDENVDSVVVVLTPQSGTDVTHIAQEIVNRKNSKPIVCIFMGGSHVREGINLLLQNQVPAFQFLEQGLQAVKALKISNYNS